MNAFGLAAAAAFLAAGAARAQTLVPEPAPPTVLLSQPEKTLSATAPLLQPFAAIQPTSRTYLKNIAEPDRMPRDPAAFGRWVTDPRLLAGVQLTPFVALEAGYVNLYDRGTHLADFAHPEDANGALNVKGLNSHAAVRLTIPVSERFEAYGKLGTAYSEYKYHDKDTHATVTEPDVGVYASAGAKYKLNEKASVSGAFERYGDSQRWGPNTNNNSLKAKVNLGF